jgi:hypothetical protein
LKFQIIPNLCSDLSWLRSFNCCWFATYQIKPDAKFNIAIIAPHSIHRLCVIHAIPLQGIMFDKRLIIYVWRVQRFFIRYKNNLFHIFDLSLAAIQVAKILLHMSIISSYFKVSTHEIILLLLLLLLPQRAKTRGGIYTGCIKKNATT